MAGYRPLGLSSAAPSTIIAGRATSYADRRQAAAERLSRTAQISQRLDAVVEAPSGTAAPSAPDDPVDPEGTLRSAIRALIPLAYRSKDFDVTVCLGPDHRWGVRVRRGPDGVSAELVPVPGGSAGAAGPEKGQSAASEAEIAAELATLLWTGEVKAR